MITTAFLSILVWYFGLILGLLPTYSGLPTGMESAMDTIANYTAQIGDIMPTGTIWTIIQAVIVIELGILVFNFVAWIFHWKQPKA